ncbi:hypothetical protein U9M48_002737 [Paspalum notatum var. saurae]|uniref:Uncharacterized protein n=1 Tax=Paspalum notatum var. saurae TaxID=547442 RepID=A0AAQ3SDN2_PASNO
MDFATGAMGTLIPKLGMLLKEQYDLQKSVKGSINFLIAELESIQASLQKVSCVPADQLDRSIVLWARYVREMSYDIEDSLDSFLVCVEGNNNPAAKVRSISRFIDRILKLLPNAMIHRKLALDIRDIMGHVKEVKERHDRYNIGSCQQLVARRYDFDNFAAIPTTTISVDPRLEALYRKEIELVGVCETRDELINMLKSGDDMFKKKLKVISVVGIGGLGKTTIAKAVYDQLKADFECCAFVSVGRNPDLKKVLRDILLQLDKELYKEDIQNLMIRDEKQLIDLLMESLGKRRYFIVIDDLWDVPTWKIIKLALVENNLGSKLVATTRIFDVAKEAGEVYKLDALSYYNSKKLFYTRIFGGEQICQDNLVDDVPDRILRKCGGIPLAIITMASLLAGKQREEWLNVQSSIRFSDKDNQQVANTMGILAYSYYDMPFHLRICFLYLSVFPEDYVIDKDRLIWMWIAEGFIHREQGVCLFELGERYFNELLNRSMIQPVAQDGELNIIDGCRLHDMVLEMILSLSRQENFVTIFDNEQDRLAQINVRRVSLQSRTIGCITHAQMDVTHEHLTDLIHLRYLGLKGTCIGELPKKIGALKFLQTLDLGITQLQELPWSIVLLAQLLCLRATVTKAIAPGIIKKLTSLEEFQIVYLSSSKGSESVSECKQFLTELGSLRELRVLHININVRHESLEEDLMESLTNLRKLCSLHIQLFFQGSRCWEAPGFVLSRHLQLLRLPYINFRSLPTWISSSLLPSLCTLELSVKYLHSDDMRMLGSLPELCSLKLFSMSHPVVYGGDGYFQKLRFLSLDHLLARFKKDKSGAPIMPSLESLHLEVSVREWMESTAMGLENILSLENLSFRILATSATPREVEEMEAALRHAAAAHPNHPTLQIQMVNRVIMGACVPV